MPAAGRLSINCSRQSWLVSSALDTPSAISSARCTCLDRRLAATLTEKPRIASSAEAAAITSAACAGATDSGLVSRAVASRAREAIAEPVGRPAGISPPRVRSHRWDTGSGAACLLASTCCSVARSTTSAPAPASDCREAGHRGDDLEGDRDAVDGDRDDGSLADVGGVQER
ncbi:MAG TPA: hypothetical protein VGS19_25975 [Streptosporangiaceae bacterium]|nr:hypothetical protein [Streptosporangiaceae bacterium]